MRKHIYSVLIDTYFYSLAYSAIFFGVSAVVTYLLLVCILGGEVVIHVAPHNYSYQI